MGKGVEEDGGEGEEGEEGGRRWGVEGDGGRGWRVAQVVLLIYDFLTFPTQGGLQSGCFRPF